MRMTQVAVPNIQPHPPASSTSLGLMSCVRESSPPLEESQTSEPTRQESRRRRFDPFKGLRNIFKKKNKNVPTGDTSIDSGAPDVTLQSNNSPVDPMRSRSTSQLSDTDPSSLKNRGLQHSNRLSLSHDSVFTAESGSEVETSSSLSVQKAAQSSVRAELLDVVRRRKIQRDDSDDEDLGLPRSPLSTSPHHKMVMNNKSSHSTLGDGSLLSLGSSEIEDEVCHPRHTSSKVSIYEKKVTITSDSDIELNIGVHIPPSIPKLSHSAAKHKMAVRPKRTHGAPRRRKQIGVPTVLPVTPEVNEDFNANRNTTTLHTDEVDNKHSETSNNKVKSIEDLNRVGAPALLSESQLKSASLPVGSIPPSTSLRLSRSRSNVTPTNQVSSSLSEDYLSDSSSKKDDGSFFSRLLSRRSGKKKKGNEDSLPPVIPHKRMDEKGQYLVDMNNITSKQYPSSRQRMEPLNIPLEESAATNRMHVSYVTTLPEAEKTDSIEVAKPEPYLLRMYSQQDAEFKPVQKTFSFKQTDSNCTSLDTTPSLPVIMSMTTPEIHTIPENDSKDVLLDETVIENVIKRSPSTMSDASNEDKGNYISTYESHTIVISHKTDHHSKPNVPQKPIACVIPVRPNARQNVPNSPVASQVSMVFLNNENNEGELKNTIISEETYSKGITDSRNDAPQILDTVSKHCQDKPPINPVSPKEKSARHLSLNLTNPVSPIKDVTPSPTHPRRSVPSSPVRESPKHRSPLKEISPFKMDSPIMQRTPSKEKLPFKMDSPQRSPSVEVLPFKTDSPKMQRSPSIEISPYKMDSPKSFRSPSREVSPFKLDSSTKIQRSPSKEWSPSGLESPKHTSSHITVPLSPSREKKVSTDTSNDFFSGSTTNFEYDSLETSTTQQKSKEIPSPVTPKDLNLSKEINSSLKTKDNLFAKEIPFPIMPKDVFQFNTNNNINNNDNEIPRILEKSTSYTEVQKREVPIPAPRTSLRKDNSLPAMPEFMKIHLQTTEIKNETISIKDSSDSNTSCAINVGSKKSISSSCESLDTRGDPIQSSSYSDSCDSIDNLDQWGNNKKNENKWRNNDNNIDEHIKWRNKNESSPNEWRNNTNRYSEISSSDSDDKQINITPDGSDIEKEKAKDDEEEYDDEISIVQLRRKSFNNTNTTNIKDWKSTSQPLRQKSLEPDLLKKDKNINNTNINEVVLRRKSLSKEIINKSNETSNNKTGDEPPELLKVFARRSLKISKDFDVNDNTIDFNNLKLLTTKDSDKENEIEEDHPKPKDNNINLSNNNIKNNNFETTNNINKIINNNEDKKLSPKKEVIKTFNTKTNDNLQKTVNETFTENVLKDKNLKQDSTLNDTGKTDDLNKKDIVIEHKTDNNVNKTDDNVPRFKKIQQRREEWEMRLQQARKGSS